VRFSPGRKQSTGQAEFTPNLSRVEVTWRRRRAPAACGELPARERVLDKVCVEVTGIIRDFVTHPEGLVKGLVFTFEFHFGNDQSCVLAKKLINLPCEITYRNPLSRFLDQRFLGKRL
jgi:hypothetical protein